jgi:predicted  nucleic acid-binding Zn-ribbon protein
LVDAAREHEELLVLRERTSLLENEIQDSLRQAEARQRDWALRINDVNGRVLSLELEKKDLETEVGMLMRQIERYKNSLNEVEIIVQKYDDLNQKDHEKHLRELINNIKVEVEAV